MNMVNLEYFITVAEEMNITRAAERLCISQQALSNHIRHLENELNTTLFIRSPSLSLTYSGKCLLRAALNILDIHSQLNKQIDDINNDRGGELRIGISYTRGQSLLPKILTEYMKKHPRVEVSLVEKNSSELEDELARGTIDILFGFSPFMLRSIESVPIMKEHLYLIVPKVFMHQLFHEQYLTIQETFMQNVNIEAFKDMPFILLNKGNRIRALVDTIFRTHNITPHIIFETENTQTACCLAAEGLGITFYPEMFLKSKYTAGIPSDLADCFPLHDKDTTVTLSIGYHSDRYLSKPAQDFIRLCQETFAETKNY